MMKPNMCSGKMVESDPAVLVAPRVVADTLRGGVDMDHRIASFGTRHGAPLTERFWAKVERGPDCWLWLASAAISGHGRIAADRAPGGPKRLLQAHRVSWELHYGPIPDGLHVLHRCDVPRCVRPDHLFLGTHLDNIADMNAKGRARGGRTYQPGEINGMAKLTVKDVRMIRKRRADGETVRGLAAEFGMSPAQVSRICTGQRWGHV